MYVQCTLYVYVCILFIYLQEFCPFNIILEDPSAAGGDPTFLCEGKQNFFTNIMEGQQLKCKQLNRGSAA